jgi:hypothetical protein
LVLEFVLPLAARAAGKVALKRIGCCLLGFAYSDVTQLARCL